MIGPPPERVAVIGAGGHAKVVIATLQAAGLDVVAAYDDDVAKLGRVLLGVPVKGNLRDFAGSGHQRGIVAIGDNTARSQVVAELEQSREITWVSAIHPGAFVHPSVGFGAGTVICAGAIVQPGSTIGAHVIVNTAATIDHDCIIHDLAHLAPGTHLAGCVQIGRGALIGIGAVVAPGHSVGQWSTVGAGAVVVSDVGDSVTVAGVPARAHAGEAGESPNN